jgi:DNA replication protein DnaC
MVQLQDATIRQHCKALRMPTIGSQFSTLAEQAVREKTTHLAYLEALLTVEMEEREKNTIDRRIKEARLPRVKTIEEFEIHPVAAGHGREDARPGKRRIHRTCGTGSSHR